MLTKIKYNNDKILGDLELNFTKQDGTAYNTIILAGENGTGKTTVLQGLADFLNFERFQFGTLEYKLGTEEFILEKSESTVEIFHNRIKKSTNQESLITHSRYDQIKTDTEDLRYYGFAFTKAKTGFSTDKIQSTKASVLDGEKIEADKNDNYTSIKQLIVDIDTQDAQEIKNILETKGSITAEEKQKIDENRKIARFKNAFNSFFEDLKFKRVDNNNSSEIEILFEKHGKEFSIDNLSTGEKQIVFRGTQLLKNQNNLDGGIVIIDEPELSLHPKWQEKILKYYQNLFTKNGKQTVQIIIATHSQWVLKSALEDPDNTLVIALKNDKGTINCDSITAPKVLPSITSAEINYVAFGIVSTDYHNQLYGYLQNKTNNISVKACDQYISAQPDYDPQLHCKPSTHDINGTPYDTLCTFIRNAIDHPNLNRTFNEKELQTSIELLIKLC